MKKKSQAVSKKKNSGAGTKTARRPPATAGKKKKEAEKKPAARGKTKRDQVLKKLNASVKHLDEAGIGMLLQQAEVLLHNMKVAKLNEERRRIAEQKKSPKTAPRFDKKSIEVVEADDLRHFILVINNARNFFSRDEMRKLAAICQGAADAAEGARNLYAWFSRYRKDVLIDVSIDNPSDIALGVMYRAIKERYTPK